MFTSGKERRKEVEQQSKSTNTIGKGTTIKGDVDTHGNIRIEGKTIGHVKSKAKIVLGASGCVQGDVMASNADIEGEVKGKIEIAETLALKSTAIVHGDIVTGRLVVESGAVFNGNCKMGGLVRDIKMKGDDQAKDFLVSEVSKAK